MFSFKEDRNAQRANGLAMILAIGTANPPDCFYQSTFPDFYFRVTNSEHKTGLKEKFKRCCDKSMIKKRYMHLNEDMLRRNPNMCEYNAPSLDARQEILIAEVPKLAKEAADNAIKEWGQPKSQITHLIFSTSSGIHKPGADYQLTNLLGLSPSVKRYMFYNQGCFAGGTGIRLAKDLAENNKGARVLVVCCDMMAALFRGPSEINLDVLVVMSLFGDGAGACIVGADPIPEVEKPVFGIVSGSQTLIPDSGGAIVGPLRESGLSTHLQRDVPSLISQNIKKNLVEVFRQLDCSVSDWNSLFWVVHPGGRAILDKLETELGLEPSKLRATRHVLKEFGNMAAASVIFVLDEMRKKSAEEKLTSTGEGHQVGLLAAFGPGVTIEIVVIHSVSI